MRKGSQVFVVIVFANEGAPVEQTKFTSGCLLQDFSAFATKLNSSIKQFVRESERERERQRRRDEKRD